MNLKLCIHKKHKTWLFFFDFHHLISKRNWQELGLSVKNPLKKREPLFDLETYFMT